MSSTSMFKWAMFREILLPSSARLDKIYSAFIKFTVDVSHEKNKKKAWAQPTVYKLSVRSCPFTKLKNK